MEYTGATVAPAIRPDKKFMDLRKLKEYQRKVLEEGEILSIVKTDGTIVSRMRVTVFNAASTKPDLCHVDKIHLPTTIEGTNQEQALKWFISHMNKLNNLPVPMFEDAERDLLIVHVAEQLGMRKYVQHIFNAYYKPLKNHELSFAHLIGIVKAENPVANKLYFDASYDLATLAWDNTIEDTKLWEEELMVNNKLAASVDKLHGIWTDAINRQEKQDKLREIRQLEHEEQVKAQKTRELEHVKLQKQREAMDKVMWAEKASKEAALEKSCQQKVLAANARERKFTVDERLHWLRTKGKQPPKGC